MRKNLFRAVAVLALALSPAAASAQSLSAQLSGANGGDADGVGYAVINVVGTQIDYTLMVQNIAAPTMAHIHRGGAGVTGPVVINFNPTFIGGLAVGTVTGTDAALVAELLGNPFGFYVAVHNAEFAPPASALRGQLHGIGGVSTPTTLYLPVVSKVAGQAGTNFLTDLVIGNPNAADLDVTVAYVESNTAGLSEPTATQTVTVPAMGQLVVADAVDELFGASGRGAAVLSASHTIFAQARIYNDQRGTSFPLPGTFSQFSRAMEMSSALPAGVLLGLTNNADYRTNIGFLNPHTTAVSATVSAFASDGTLLGARTVTLAPWANDIQPVFAFINTVSETTQDGFFVRFTTSGGDVFMFASMVDNLTGDAVYVTPQAGM